MLVAAVIGAILVLTTTFHGLTDVDYFWHVTTGRLIANTGIPHSDQFSFTYTGGPWTLHEWLSQLLIYLMVTYLGGLVTLVAFGLVGGAAVAVAMAHARARGARVAPIALAAAICTGVVVSYLTVRPQAISWLLLAILVWFLCGLAADHPRRALFLLPFFVIWANLHGLYVVGLGVVAIWLAATLLGRTPIAGARLWALAGGAGALVGSLITPAGPAGILYPLRYVQPGNWGISHIQEWLSPNFHDPVNLGLLLLLGSVLLAGWRGPAGSAAMPSWQRIVVTILLLASLVSLRNAPLAAVTALPVLALSIDGWIPRRAVRPHAPGRARARRYMEMVLAAVIITAAAVILVPRVESNSASAVRERLPVAGVDHLMALKPDARVFAEYGWGGYVIYRMYDSGGRVFVDGRNDMYPESILNDYSTVRDAGTNWKAKLDSYGADAILLPPGAGLVTAARTNNFWCEEYTDAVQVLFVRCDGS
jgi:hypothetical protein